MLHGILGDGSPDLLHQPAKHRDQRGRNGSFRVVFVKFRKFPVRVIIIRDLSERPPKGDLFRSLLALSGFLGNIVLNERIVVQQPFLDKQAQREFDMVAVLPLQMLVFLRDLHSPAEEGILIGRVLAVPLNNRVDRFEMLEIKRLHREEISVRALALFDLLIKRRG